MRVEILESKSSVGLQVSINSWLRENEGVEVNDIKFQVNTVDVMGEFYAKPCAKVYAMIIYSYEV